MPSVRTTDGASAASEGAGAWEAAFADGKSFGDSLTSEAAAAIGIDGETPPAGDGESSAGAPTGSPESAPPAPTGDDGAPPAPSPVDPPPAGDPAAPPTETDPLAGAEPFTYTVDGKPETFEGAFRLPGDGVYVPEDKVPAFQLAMSQAKTLDRQVRELHDRNQTWERLTAWTEKDAQGNDRTVTGREAIEAQRVNVATTGAVLQTMLKALSDPAMFAELHDVVGNETDGYSIVRNEKAWASLVRESRLSAQEAAQQARAHVSKLSVPPPPPEPSVADVALPTVKATIANAQVTGLTAQDETFLAGQLQHYVRPATPAERQQFGSPRIVDASFTALVKHQAALRAEAAKAVTAGAKTDKFNDGMQKGRQPAPAPAKPAAPAPAAARRGSTTQAPAPRGGQSPNDMWSSLVAEAQQVSI